VGVTKGDLGNIPFLIRLLQENTDVNIRSTPLLLVNDNQEAQFSSLLEEPTTATSQGTATTRISFAGFVEAGTVLRITPHVSEGNYIRVDVDLKVDNFFGQSPGPGIPPPRATNQLVTSITVPDSRTVVIGGLTTTKKTEVRRGIPLLSQIPLLGYLFSSTVEQNKTSRLFLFIRPQIMDDVDFKDLNRISTDKSIEVKAITGEEIVPPDDENDKKGETREGVHDAPDSKSDPGSGGAPETHSETSGVRRSSEIPLNEPETEITLYGPPTPGTFEIWARNGRPDGGSAGSQMKVDNGDTVEKKEKEQ
jgi:type II secretory pathway component GspD/PulD (secretin)